MREGGCMVGEAKLISEASYFSWRSNELYRMKLNFFSFHLMMFLFLREITLHYINIASSRQLNGVGGKRDL